MTEDQDNAGEVIVGAVRVALTAAGQLAEQAARRSEADLREAERDSAARVATLQSQLAAERELALRSVRDVVQRGNAATVNEVVRAWEQARSWDDATMGYERVQLQERIRERFGVEAVRLAADRGVSEQTTAATVAVRDIALQAGAAHDHIAAQSEVSAPGEEFVVAGNDQESAAARALAAESHPTPASWAAQIPRGVPTPRPRGKRRGHTVEL